MSELLISLLGRTQILLDGRALSFRTNKVQALLCYMVVEAINQPGIAFRREALLDLLWPDMPLKSAQDNLRQTLYQLKKTMPETAVGDNTQSFILSDRLAIRINPAAAYALDVAQFQELTEAGATPEALEKAAALYRGDFLADFYLPDSNTFEDWAADWRNMLQSKALTALENLTDWFLEQGHYEKAESRARQQVEIDDLRESGYRQLMSALAENGRRNEALKEYERCRERLLEELGVEPAAETTAIFEKIQAGESSPRRYKARMQPISGKPGQRRQNLPAQTTSFVGRDSELEAVVQLLKEPDCRLLTLLGPGGIGKTRLSLQAALLLANEPVAGFQDGIFQIPLAAARSMEELVPAIAEAVGFSFSGSRKPRDQITAYLKNKEVLLVLDNLEHLAGDSGLLSELLTAVPGLTFLVTSRARLNLYEEWRYELEGLSVPEETAVDELESYSAVQLFIQRARQAGLVLSENDDLAVVGRICHLLAGMPLGIELAAGWVRTHSLEQITAEIERNLSFLNTTIQNVPLRHRSLQVTFDHSWRLLPADLQQAWAKASVFRGGFGREAAEYVTGASPLVLAMLVDHSMLHAEGGRFQMNEPLRQFGEEKLTAGEKGAVCQAHADYYASFLANREGQRWTAEEPAVLDEIGLDLKNILVGWHWLFFQLDHSPSPSACLPTIGRYIPMLAHFYLQRSRFHEGVNLFQEAVERISAVDEKGARTADFYLVLAQLQMAEAMMRFHLSQFGQVEALLAESMAVFREQGDRSNLAFGLVWLGKTYNRLGKFEAAYDLLEDSLSLFREVGARVAGAEALNGLGIVATSQERFDVGEQFLQESLAIYRETGYQGGIARALSNLGTVTIRKGKFEPAHPLYEAALKAARSINDAMAIAVVLSNLGGTACFLGNYEASLGYYEESLEMFREMGEQRWIAVGLNGLGETYLEMGNIETAVANLRQSLEISTAIQSVPDSLDSLAALGEISALVGHEMLALRLATFVTNNQVTKPLARARAEKILTRLKEKIAPEILGTAPINVEKDTLSSLTAEALNNL